MTDPHPTDTPSDVPGPEDATALSEADAPAVPPLESSAAEGTEEPAPSTSVGALPMPVVSVQAEVKDFHFPPVINGLDFLARAVQELAPESPRADLKYGILHLQAAAETLFKARLEMHDPVLVWRSPEGFDKEKHQAGDFKSHDLENTLRALRKQVKEKALNLHTSVPAWKPDLKALSDLRNRIAHFGGRDTRLAVQARVLPILHLVFDLVREDIWPYVLSSNAVHPGDMETAGSYLPRIRRSLGKLDDFVAQRHESIRAQLAGHERSTIACRACGQFAVVLDGRMVDLKCHFCGKTYGSGAERAWSYVGSDPLTQCGAGTREVFPCGFCDEEAVIVASTKAAPQKTIAFCFACDTHHDGICGDCEHGRSLNEFGLCDACTGMRVGSFGEKRGSP
ncbi:hypothetical protein ACFYZ6_25955 [Streptomyces rubiginosohelvolus]|uniref:hypothetical protein n=1 Tax=Streptomyces rubiginosohelvolus TaxID=67362 RepID=UPI0036BF12A5